MASSWLPPYEEIFLHYAKYEPSDFHIDDSCEDETVSGVSVDDENIEETKSTKVEVPPETKRVLTPSSSSRSAVSLESERKQYAIKPSVKRKHSVDQVVIDPPRRRNCGLFGYAAMPPAIPSPNSADEALNDHLAAQDSDITTSGSDDEKSKSSNPTAKGERTESAQSLSPVKNERKVAQAGILDEVDEATADADVEDNIAGVTPVKSSPVHGHANHNSALSTAGKTENPPPKTSRVYKNRGRPRHIAEPPSARRSTRFAEKAAAAKEEEEQKAKRRTTRSMTRPEKATDFTPNRHKKHRTRTTRLGKSEDVKKTKTSKNQATRSALPATTRTRASHARALEKGIAGRMVAKVVIYEGEADVDAYEVLRE